MTGLLENYISFQMMTRVRPAYSLTLLIRKLLVVSCDMAVKNLSTSLILVGFANYQKKTFVRFTMVSITISISVICLFRNSRPVKQKSDAPANKRRSQSWIKFENKVIILK